MVHTKTTKIGIRRIIMNPQYFNKKQLTSRSNWCCETLLAIDKQTDHKIDGIPQLWGAKIVHQIQISTINDSSMMLGIETVFGRPYYLPQLRIDSWIWVEIVWTDHINPKANIIQDQMKNMNKSQSKT